MGLQMTSFGIIMPLFARRLGDFGSGAEALALMAMAYALTSTVASPFMGSLADRFGRRPLVLGPLAAYVAAFTGYALATSTGTFILIRTLAGVLTAGLGPAVMGIVGDVAPEQKRARWIGVVGGGSAVGWIVGPLIGGMLYDRWGFAVPFTVSAAMACVAFVTAFIVLPETRDARQRKQAPATTTKETVSSRTALPRPLSTFAGLLFISFVIVFAWTFVEPHLMFYVYDELDWTSARFGLAVSGYGVALVFGQTVLGQLSDKFGRKLVLIVGVLLHSTQYVGLMVTPSFILILLAYAVAGLGDALISPALSAFYLDITPEQHRSRVMGFKGSAGSLGSVIGPALAVAVTRLLAPERVFTVSAALLVLGALVALVVLKEPERASAKAENNEARESFDKRATTAQASSAASP
jgi:DHA1 family tetracycline resistance protein-like MFS transporter